MSEDEKPSMDSKPFTIPDGWANFLVEASPVVFVLTPIYLATHANGVCTVLDGAQLPEQPSRFRRTIGSGDLLVALLPTAEQLHLAVSRHGDHLLLGKFAHRHAGSGPGHCTDVAKVVAIDFMEVTVLDIRWYDIVL